MLINTALKEWSIAVDAIAQGTQVILLRKGGIKEDQGRFRTQSDQVVLFPTFEHQKPELLKSDYKGFNYQNSVLPVASGWHPEKITLKVWAQITDIFLTTAADQVSALSDFHIWQPQLATERLQWKPKQPLYILALRAYQLSVPVEIVWNSALYGGCRSWVPLDQPIEGSTDHPAIDSDSYNTQIKKIKEIISDRS
ncbi:conserved domain protein [Synechococcus sp. PCC 7335]|uniref:DUF1802 family protein n=1 Tax=Synechococcus sp. (strain ATCC 29403 / PCC 7335) TaxID=91464 RepID=UPI00017ECE4B|nr:DUF1802 family protein [Synechococcus sp. PCC 7335]EDX84154.1 conserved domain protein [Synechococcus sp. PCC 7335]